MAKQENSGELANVVNDNHDRVPADNPIKNTAEDRLGRDSVAESFVDQVMSLDHSEGIVVGVLGAWGNGKTSFINLSRKHFADGDIAVVDFNPWMFSGADQLVERFFVELSAQLKIRASLAEVGKAIEQYGEIFSGLGWLPVAGPWLERLKLAKDILAKGLLAKKEGSGELRDKVRKALIKAEKPIVVVIDDIDRLTTAEIRDIFKLVRLTASFPNIIYVVAFDRTRVEAALQDENIPGRDYLEKILQLAIDLPIVPPTVLRNEVFASLDKALVNVEDGSLDKTRWPDVFAEIIHPLIRNMRDVRRYTVAVAGTVENLKGQVDLVDLLGVEAIRTFLPDVFSKIQPAVIALTKPEGHQDSKDLKTAIDAILSAAGSEKETVVRAMITRQFPAATRHITNTSYGIEWLRTWRKSKRIAHEDFLRLYLERTVGEGLQSFLNAKRVWALIEQPNELDVFIRSLAKDQWEALISELEAYEDEFETIDPVPAIVLLLNLWPEVPERESGLFDFGRNLTIRRVILRLLRSLKTHEGIEEAVRAVLLGVPSLSSQLEVITNIGHIEGAGHKLLPEDVAADFERAWRAGVRGTDAATLSGEWNLLRVLWMTKLRGLPEEPPFNLPESDELMLALLRSAETEEVSHSFDSRAVKRSPRIAWQVLIDVVGSEEEIARRVEPLLKDGDEANTELLELVNRYLSGNPPPDIED